MIDLRVTISRNLLTPCFRHSIAHLAPLLRQPLPSSTPDPRSMTQSRCSFAQTKILPQILLHFLNLRRMTMKSSIFTFWLAIFVIFSVVISRFLYAFVLLTPTLST